MGHLGLEPRTIRLKAEYSTIELVTLFFYIFNYTKLSRSLLEELLEQYHKISI